MAQPFERLGAVASPSYAFVTLCARNDIDRCRLLHASMEDRVDSAIPHYLAVDRRDIRAFDEFARDNVRVVAVEEIVPWWIRRFPGAKKWWASLKSLPIRNWLLQQYVKLSLPVQAAEDVFLFVDTDVAFIRPFDPRSFIRDGKVRLFRVPGANPVLHAQWHRTAGKLLGLPPQDYYGASYIGNIVSWRKDCVRALHDRIERVSGRPWLEAVARHWHLSEYILYGVCAEHVLGDDAGHYYDDLVVCHAQWSPDPMADDELGAFFGQVREHHVAIMLTGKAGISPERYARYVIRQNPADAR